MAKPRTRRIVGTSIIGPTIANIRSMSRVTIPLFNVDGHGHKQQGEIEILNDRTLFIMSNPRNVHHSNDI